MTGAEPARALALGGPRDRVGRAETLSEDAAQIEHEAQREPWVGQPEPLKRRLGQDERLGILERDNIRFGPDFS